MPFVIPTIAELRRLGRDGMSARIPGADATVPNSLLRVLSDMNAGGAGLNLQYLIWLSRQIMADTAEAEWLLRLASLFLRGGRKAATVASGTATLTGIAGTIVPIDTVLIASNGTRYRVTATRTIGETPVTATLEALDAGAAGNQLEGASLGFAVAIAGVDGQATVVSIRGGIAEEPLDDLRLRLLERLRTPPMGGDADDYVAWAKEVPGVTRAWCAPAEMGAGTVTVRFMMDHARAEFDGFPTGDDVADVYAYLTLRRQVTADLFVAAPVPEPIDFAINDLVPDDSGTKAAIEIAVKAMLRDRARPAFTIDGVTQPAQTIFSAWISEAVLSAAGVDHFGFVMTDHAMPSPGHIGVLGDITYG